MTEASQYLLTLSKRIAEPYTKLPTARAAMVTGSAAKNLSDYYSDLDMTLYYEDELPDEDALQAIRGALGGSDRKWLIGDRETGSFAEAYGIDGIEVQIGHTTITSWEETMAEVLEKLEVDTPIQKALEGTLACKALYGEDLINKWKAMAADYPPALAEAMVKKHLAFFSLWGLEQHFRTRDATIWYYQILVESAHNMMAVLAGINRLYFTTFQFKRMRRFINQMKVAPPNLADRIERLFQSDLAIALPELEILVTEIVEIVEIQMPDVDTERIKKRLGWRQSAWEPAAS